MCGWVDVAGTAQRTATRCAWSVRVLGKHEHGYGGFRVVGGGNDSAAPPFAQAPTRALGYMRIASRRIRPRVLLLKFAGGRGLTPKFLLQQWKRG